jgi:hypothetical protein
MLDTGYSITSKKSQLGRYRESSISNMVEINLVAKTGRIYNSYDINRHQERRLKCPM